VIFHQTDHRECRQIAFFDAIIKFMLPFLLAPEIWEGRIEAAKVEVGGVAQYQAEYPDR
jgi:hypothetical protein